MKAADAAAVGIAFPESVFVEWGVVENGVAELI